MAEKKTVRFMLAKETADFPIPTVTGDRFRPFDETPTVREPGAPYPVNWMKVGSISSGKTSPGDYRIIWSNGIVSDGSVLDEMGFMSSAKLPGGDDAP